MNTRSLPPVRLLFLSCIAGVSLVAGEVSDSDNAERLLHDVLKRTSAAENFSVDISYEMDVRMMGMTQEMESLYSFGFAQPNKLSLTLKEGMIGQTVVSDGETLYIHFPMFDMYTAADAPEDLEGLLGEATVMGGEVLLMMRPLITGAVNGVELASIADVAYIGVEEREGESLHRLEVVLRPDDIEEKLGEQVGDGMDETELALFGDFDFGLTIDVWVTADDPPVLSEIRADLSEMMEAMSGEVEGMADFGEVEMEMGYVFRNWTFDEPLPEDTFVFTPPAGAEEVDDLMAAMERAAGEMGNEGPGPQALVGEAAPEFELETLEGGEFALSDHLGEDIVILDFWATWCGPCIQAMPTLIEVADEYRDRDVVFYAVNQREETATVEDFIEARGWNLNVPMDRRGSVADQYQVSGIPHTVIIGKDGSVQAVHVGYSPNLKQTLTGELDTLLTGESLY